MIVVVVGETANMPAWAPLTVIPKITRLAVPVLNIASNFWEVELILVESKASEVTTAIAGLLAGGGVVDFPIPDTTICIGEPTALWVILRIVDFWAAVDGTNVTVTV